MGYNFSTQRLQDDKQEFLNKHVYVYACTCVYKFPNKKGQV